MPYTATDGVKRASVRSRLTSVQAFGGYNKDQSLALRIMAYRLMMFERMDRKVLAEYLNLSMHQTTGWMKDIDNAESVFVRELVSDMAANPSEYSPAALLSRCRGLGLEVKEPPVSVSGLLDVTSDMENNPATTIYFKEGKALKFIEALPPEKLLALNGEGDDEALPTRASKKQTALTLEERIAIQVPTRDIGSLLLTYLGVSLETLAIQALFMRDEAWLRQQRAGELAQLHTAMTTHTLKIVEAMAAAQGSLIDDGPTEAPFTDERIDLGDGTDGSDIIDA